MPAPTATPTGSHVHALRFAHDSTRKLIDGVPKEKLCAQPGSCANHAMWVVGHLACTDDYILKEFAFAKLALPDSWHKSFGGGSKPTSDPSEYPPPAEVKKAFDERHAALVQWVESLTPEELDKPTPEGWQPYAPTIGDVVYFCTWHSGYHSGQLTALRRAFGLPAAFG